LKKVEILKKGKLNCNVEFPFKNNYVGVLDCIDVDVVCNLVD